MELDLIKNYEKDEEIKKVYNYLCTFDSKDTLVFSKIFHLPKLYDLDITIEEAKGFYDSFFILHDVLYKDINDPTNKYYMIRNISNPQHKINPFDIPIKKSIIDNIYLNCERFYVCDKLYNLNFNITLPIYHIDDLITESYAHEICHTQYQDDNYVYLNLHDEILPIFIERLCNDFRSDDNKAYFYRLYDLKKKIELLNKKSFKNVDSLYKQDTIKYIESTLKAYMLYFIYENETNTSSKARIIDDIQSIFDEEMTLTELLNKHNINENYKKHELIRRYIK